MASSLFYCFFNTFLLGAVEANSFGIGSGQFHNARFYCSGSEANLLSCSYSTYSCYYSYGAGVQCEGTCISNLAYNFIFHTQLAI